MLWNRFVVEINCMIGCLEDFIVNIIVIIIEILIRNPSVVVICVEMVKVVQSMAVLLIIYISNLSIIDVSEAATIIIDVIVAVPTEINKALERKCNISMLASI